MQYGWRPDPAEVERVLGMLPVPIVGSDSPIAGSWDGKTSYYLGNLELKVCGKRLKPWTQKRGVCVSKGFGRAAQDQLFADIIQRGEAEEWPGKEIATEPIYAGSRVEVGGGRISGDGSVGAWAAPWLLKWGVLFRDVYTVGGQKVDLSREDDDIAARWGAPGRGVPEEIETLSKEHPVKECSLVTDIDRAFDLFANWYGIAVCSMQGFTMRRDSRGFCQPSGSWAHCMYFRGVVVLKDGTVALVCKNSWDEYLGSPITIELYDGSTIELDGSEFLVRPEVAAKMLGQRDSFAVCGVKGIQRRQLIWEFA